MPSLPWRSPLIIIYHLMWRNMWPVIAGLLVVAALGFIGLVGWLNSASFDQFVARRLADELAKLNVRAEIGQVDVRPLDLSLEIHQMRLFAGEAPSPFFAVTLLEAKLKILDVLSRRFELHYLRLNEPVVNLVFDAQGRSNLADIDLAPLRRRRPEEGPDVEIGQIAIHQGVIVYNHQQNQTSGEARRVQIAVRPEPQAIGVTLTTEQAYVCWNERVVDDVSVELAATLNQQGATLSRARLTTPFADALMNGTMRHWSKPEYELSVISTLDLTRLAEEMKLSVELSGTAELMSRIAGQDTRFQLTGTLTSPKLGIAGVQLVALRLQAEGSTAGEVDTSDSAGANEQAFWLRGLWQSRRIRPGGVELSDFRGALLVTPDGIDISRFSASTLRGQVAGEASIKFAGTSSLDAVFRSLDLHQAVAHLAGRDWPISGTVGGHARFQWPATEFEQIAGRAQVRIESPTSEISEFLPARGIATVAISGRGIHVLDSQVTIGAAQIDVRGWIGWDRAVDLKVAAALPRLAEQERFLTTLGIDLRHLTRGIVATLSGSGSFLGHLRSRGHQITLSGGGTIRDLKLASGSLTMGRAQIEYHDRVVTLTKTTAVFDDGSRLTLALFRDELERENGITLKGELQQISLGQWRNLLDVSLPLTGQATGDFDLTGLPGALRGRADITVVRGRIQPPQFTMAFDRLTVRFIAHEMGYEVSPLKLERGPNVITVSGTYRPPTHEYALTAQGLNLDVSQFDDEMEKRGYPLTGRLDFHLSGAGKLAQPQLDARVRLAQLTIAGKPAGSLSGDVHAERGDIRWTLTAALFGQQQTVTGRLDLTHPDQPLSLHADLNHLQASPYLQLALGTTDDLSLILHGQVDLMWPLVYPERRRLVASLTQVQMKVTDLILSNESPFTLKLAGSRLDVPEVRFRGDGTDVTIGGRVDFTPTAQGQSGLAYAQLNLTAHGTVNLQIANALSPGLVIGGLARVQTTIRGTLRDPDLSGIADLENASARWRDLPVALHDGYGRVRFTENRFLLERFAGQANEGEVTLEGGMLADNFRPQRWQFTIRTHNVVVRYPEGWRSVLDGELALRGSRQLQVLSGFLNVRHAEYTRDLDVAELVLRGPSVLKGRPGVKGSLPVSLALDIRVHAADTISIRNNLANAQASAWFHIGGTLAEPQISGRATVTRGTLELRDRDYDITVGMFEFPDRARQEVRFHLEAQADISGYQVTIGFSGTPSRFKPMLRSEPPLPTEAIVSLISTGRADMISRQTQTLAQSNLGIATSLISEALSQQLEQRLARQRFFGINRFQVEPLLVGRGSDPTARITVGQQITKDLSITYSVNVATNDEPIVILEYKLSDRFYLVGARDERGEFSIDVRVRKRF